MDRSTDVLLNFYQVLLNIEIMGLKSAGQMKLKAGKHVKFQYISIYFDALFVSMFRCVSQLTATSTAGCLKETGHAFGPVARCSQTDGSLGTLQTSYSRM